MTDGRIPSLMDPFLYVIGAEKGPVKIGIAECPTARLANLQIAHYLELFILAEAQIGGVEDEQRVHELFREQRLRGEWFRRSREVVTFTEMITGLGVYRATANVLKSREAKRPLHPHERVVQQWATANMQPLGPRPVPSPSPPMPTQVDADRFANSLRKAGLVVAEASIQNGKVTIKIADGRTIAVANTPPQNRRHRTGNGAATVAHVDDAQ